MAKARMVHSAKISVTEMSCQDPQALQIVLALVLQLTSELASQMNISRNAVYQARREGRLALWSALKRRGHELPPAVDGGHA